MKVRNSQLVEEDGLKRLAGGRERAVGPIGKDDEERHRWMMFAQRSGEHSGERHEVLRDDGADGAAIIQPVSRHATGETKKWSDTSCSRIPKGRPLRNASRSAPMHDPETRSAGRAGNDTPRATAGSPCRAGSARSRHSIEPLVKTARPGMQRIAEAADGVAHVSEQRAGDIGHGRAVVERAVCIGPRLGLAIAVAFQRGAKALEDRSRRLRRSRVSAGPSTW